jgi:DNA-binding XRE family transcriptional regulator/mannose-6-phosphate isomerase-like protein (cupin superfamily)
MAKPNNSRLGERVAQLRKQANLSLADLSKLTGLARSSLYKVEGNKMSLTYDNLIKLSEGLGVDVADLFKTDGVSHHAELEDVPRSLPGRIMTSSMDAPASVKTDNYVDTYLCTSLSRKLVDPVITRVLARSLEEFGPFSRHPGEEFSYVISGQIELHTEAYRPFTLKKGEYVYFDSQMGHAYVNPGHDEALILTICVGRPPER